jgi:uncharacterized glyoxalase superfamily protein PhnB
MPSCSVIPELVYEDVGDAVRWLAETFGFQARWTAGEHRAQLAFGNGAVAVTEARSGSGYPDQPDSVDYRAPREGPVTHGIMVRVDNVDAHHARVRARGGHILHVPTDYPYGERQYEVRDPGGHRWTFSQTIADVAPEEWGGTSYR